MNIYATTTQIGGTISQDIIQRRFKTIGKPKIIGSILNKPIDADNLAIALISFLLGKINIAIKNPNIAPSHPFIHRHQTIP